MTTKRLHIYILISLTIFVLTSCIETKTSDVKDTYKYWAGTNAPADLELIHGQYWQSPNFTKEYIMYLKFKPTKEWWDEFLKQNSISADKDSWTIPKDAPLWFKPSNKSMRYGGGNDFDQDSRYFRDTITGISYIYEIQL
jgi:hypothetical protein